MKITFSEWENPQPITEIRAQNSQRTYKVILFQTWLVGFRFMVWSITALNMNIHHWGWVGGKAGWQYPWTTLWSDISNSKVCYVKISNVMISYYMYPMSPICCLSQTLIESMFSVCLLISTNAQTFQNLCFKFCLTIVWCLKALIIIYSLFCSLFLFMFSTCHCVVMSTVCFLISVQRNPQNRDQISSEYKDTGSHACRHMHAWPWHNYFDLEFAYPVYPVSLITCCKMPWINIWQLILWESRFQPSKAIWC